MPIRIPDALPATAELERENIFVMTEFRALHQDIRPLRVLILNLMPTKLATETQIMRKLSNTPLQVEVELLRTRSHEAKNVSASHLETFYRTFREVEFDHYDGLIITGAPVEQLEFEEVDYWDELTRIMDWSTENVHSTLHICWGAQAGLYHHYGIQKHPLPEKASGVFEHRLLKPHSPLVRGIDDRFMAVHSRNTEVRAEDVEAVPELEIIADSEEAGLYIVKSTDSRRFFVFGHPEYDAETLRLEYERDRRRQIPVEMPKHYFPGDDPAREPPNTWRSHAQLLYTNWLNYYVYQTTPYDLRHIGRDVRSRSGLV
ncbi:MAG: homoserine O-succinyltransferase [Coriobacteriaceae bacterium]|nr:homoserine O-succinyltransferase [Coriobacteriaceae bacterium]